ncbi:MAG TPA: ADOP family duplicated permease [Vicinamibacterales bacterium]|nr:ADOP family duplicated permease [Vicinamibacterales bacterium]
MRSAFAQAWASWKSSPGIALLAVIAFAIGIGSATAIFTVINGVILRPLPYANGNRFVALYGATTTDPNTFSSMSMPEAQDYQQQTTSFDAFGWFQTSRFNLTSPGEPQFVAGASVTPALVQQLGSPLLGQWFTDDRGVVIASSLWRRLGGSRNIIGSAITLDDRRYTVTGVVAPEFQLPISGTAMTAGDTEVWIALVASPQDENRGHRPYFSYARRKPGVSLEQAQADAKRVAANIAAKDPSRYPFYTAKVVALREATLTNLNATLLIMFAGAGLLLLIACANVATLLLARSVVRARETAIRVALGASRRQLALRYFAEGALVSVAGAAAGVAASALFVRRILDAASEFVPHADGVGIDWKVLGFTVAIAIVTGVIAGLAPLWQALRTPPNAALTDGVRASASAPARRLSQIFVVAEVALAFTLLTASVILVLHLRNLNRAPLGFDANNLLTFELVLPQRLVAAKALEPEHARLLEALRQTPGVTSATFANQLPTYPGCLETALYVAGGAPDAKASRICVVITTPEFFGTMRIPLHVGRLLAESDRVPPEQRQGAISGAVVVNETAAREYWPGRNPIGASGKLSQQDNPPFEVVGVVGDVKNNGLDKAPLPEVYLVTEVGAVNPINVIVRSNLASGPLITAVRATVKRTSPAAAINDVSMMTDVVSGTLQLERLSSLVMTFFGLSALLMATLGVYGLVSYFVRQRTVELGTRMALGAVNRDLVVLVLGGGVKLALAGIGVGSIALAAGVVLLVRVLEVQDFGWPPFAASTAVVTFVSAAAASLPAWRTTLLSPMVAMRDQPPSVWRWARQHLDAAVQDVREAVGRNDAAERTGAAVLSAFVDAARGADSYTDALRVTLAGVCRELHVESAALLERHDGTGAGYRCLAAVGLLESTVPVIADDGFLVSRLRAYPLPLPFAPNEFAALTGWAAANRPDRLDEIRALAAAGVRLAIPLLTRRELLGVLLLGEPPQRDGFSAEAKQVLRTVADELALMIENARLTDRVVEQETLRRDIALASDVQRRLLPDEPPQSEFADFSAVSIPARRIGGDYYDFVELPDHGIGIALADVSGKGVAAALIMSVVQASLRIISSDGGVAPTRLVARMNEFIYRSTPGSKYATFFYAQLEDRGRRLRYVNAGHNPPFLLRAGRLADLKVGLYAEQADDVPTDVERADRRGRPAGRPSAAQIEPSESVDRGDRRGRPSGRPSQAHIEQLTVGGTVVGMFEEATYEEAIVELNPGDVLLAFTDGVPEAHNPESEEFGEERLQELLRQHAHLPANEIRDRISWAMTDWIRDAEQYDDLTFIVMKTAPTADPPLR